MEQSRQTRKKVREVAISIPSGASASNIQKELEKKRKECQVQNDLPIIDSKMILLRMNRFMFTQKSIRPVKEDTAWGKASEMLQEEGIHRLAVLHTANDSTLSDCRIFPFSLRLIAYVNNCEFASREPLPWITSNEEFHSVLESFMTESRTNLARLSRDPEKVLYDLSIEMATIEYMHNHRHVIFL